MFRHCSAGALLAALIFTTPVVADDDAWYPSKYGADDELGSANLITPERVLAASKLVTEGKVYGLGIETNSLTPAFPPRGFKIYIVQPGQQA
ncbi:MAG: cyclase family protein, partial [Proteobacteria bacterium]|nr:cyclase family protein [Pseudomonadota bacterium]